MAESEDDAYNVVVVHDVDIEYDSSEEEEWADKTLIDTSDCGYFCWYNAAIEWNKQRTSKILW